MATLKVGGLTKRHRNIAAVNDVRFGVERAGTTGCLRTLISMAWCLLGTAPGGPKNGRPMLS
jgi:hypothetical protein